MSYIVYIIVGAASQQGSEHDPQLFTDLDLDLPLSLSLSLLSFGWSAGEVTAGVVVVVAAVTGRKSGLSAVVSTSEPASITRTFCPFACCSCAM